ncbi:hypothetical protein L21SP4_00179 [Kiritimatiella glycovorans]|uniref:Uncharacterized protein n=1 Tax=Kiritimatiella glycovorans TaxID=1307763 RepID=A0A0G3EB10_9BACT|nr:hypothetical protein L21SP4_00179 [Kiritimatiella glycovorans]
MNLYIKSNPAGEWVVIVVCAVLFFLPVRIEEDLARPIGVGLSLGIVFGIARVIRAGKLKKEPYLRFDAAGLHCLPLIGKGWTIPPEQIHNLQLNERMLSVERGAGGKRYAVAVRPLAPRERAMLEQWVETWNRTKGVRK